MKKNTGYLDLEYIDIDKSQIPYIFEVSILNETFEFEVLYNEVGDFFTITLYKNDKVISEGEKIVYGQSMFNTVRYLDTPKLDIIPFDFTYKSKGIITYENFNEDVFLYMVGDIDVD